MDRLTLFASNEDEAAEQAAYLTSIGHQMVQIDTIWGTHLGRVIQVSPRLAEPSEIEDAFDETGLHCPIALDVDFASPTLH